MFITKSELDTCLFRFVRLMDKLKTKKSLARADYYYINVLEYFTKMPLVENSIPSKFAQSLYKRIRRSPNRVEAIAFRCIMSVIPASLVRSSANKSSGDSFLKSSYVSPILAS